MGVADVELFSPVAGDQLYVFAPDAVYTMLVCPLQILMLPPPLDEMSTVGKAFTFTVTVAVFVQPVAVVVPTTEYVVLLVGEAVTILPVLLLREALGVQV